MVKVTFGSAANPLRASSLPDLLRCALKRVLMARQIIIDVSGPAADTGSLMHAAAAEWHKSGNEKRARKAMLAAVQEFPQGDTIDAAKQFSCYIADPRNNCKCVLVEEKVTITLDPWPDDPTKEAIVINGTVDQVRLVDGRLEVWDIKTSKKNGADIIWEYAMQIAAYAIAAERRLKKPVHPGGFIRTRTYLQRGVDPKVKPLGVFLPAKITREQVPALMDAVRHTVSLIRQEKIFPQSGSHCQWCPAGGLHQCLKLKGRMQNGHENQKPARRPKKAADGSRLPTFLCGGAA